MQHRNSLTALPKQQPLWNPCEGTLWAGRRHVGLCTTVPPGPSLQWDTDGVWPWRSELFRYAGPATLKSGLSWSQDLLPFSGRVISFFPVLTLGASWWPLVVAYAFVPWGTTLYPSFYRSPAYILPQTNITFRVKSTRILSFFYQVATRFFFFLLFILHFFLSGYYLREKLVNFSKCV